jgi:hypothetical protein
MLPIKKSQLFGRNDEKGIILLMIRATRARFAVPPQHWKMISLRLRNLPRFPPCNNIQSIVIRYRLNASRVSRDA